MKLSYSEQIDQKILQARKKRDAEAVVYYTQALSCSACSSWDVFKGSGVYRFWAKRYRKEIEEQEKEFKRFSYLTV